MPEAPRATLRAPSRITTRRSVLSLITPSSSTTAAMPRKRRATKTGPSPTTARRSGSTRRTPTSTAIAATPGTPRVTTCAPGPTIPRRSGSERPSRASVACSECSSALVLCLCHSIGRAAGNGCTSGAVFRLLRMEDGATGARARAAGLPRSCNEADRSMRRTRIPFNRSGLFEEHLSEYSYSAGR
jgi:hypothetical protein